MVFSSGPKAQVNPIYHPDKHSPFSDHSKIRLLHVALSHVKIALKRSRHFLQHYIDDKKRTTEVTKPAPSTQMHLHKPHHFVKLFSTLTTTINWRIQIKQNQLVSQISSILLQRQNWVQLLQTLNLSSKLNPPLLLQVLHKTQHNPQISFNFFNWAKANLGFQPDLKSHCQIIQILVGSGLFRPAKPILDSVIQTHPAPVLVDSVIRACKGSDSQTHILNFVLQCYANNGLFRDGLDVFRKMIVQGYIPSIRASNSLLVALQRENEIKLAWCFCGAVIRSGVLPDQFTWSMVAKILSKSGKFDKIVSLLDLGIYNIMIYSLVIDYYSKSGNFSAAFDLLNEMFDRKLDPGFSTYSAILDGACKCGNIEVIEKIMGVMEEKALLPKCPISEYDPIIQKLCDLGKIYVAEMFYMRAREEKIVLHDATYGCMLRALCKKGRVKDAISVYHVTTERSIKVNASCLHAFVNVLCKQDPSEEVSKLLIEMIGRGFSPCAYELSRSVASLCNKGRWREAEDLLYVILEKGSLPDSFCCCSLVEHYCSSRQIDKAVALHDKMEKLKGSLDVTTYNVLLNGLIKARMVEEVMRVFDYMRTQNLVSSVSFTIMIRELCHLRELRKAMKIHDEMLKMNLKPDEATYKHLISGFR